MIPCYLLCSLLWYNVNHNIIYYYYYFVLIDQVSQLNLWIKKGKNICIIKFYSWTIPQLKSAVVNEK